MRRIDKLRQVCKGLKIEVNVSRREIELVAPRGFRFDANGCHTWVECWTDRDAENSSRAAILDRIATDMLAACGELHRCELLNCDWCADDDIADGPR